MQPTTHDDQDGFDDNEKQQLARTANVLLECYMRCPFLHNTEIRRRQTYRIAELLDQAYRHSRVYNELYKTVGVEPKDFKELADICAFPIIRRNHLASHEDGFISSRYRGERTFRTRSFGTSGLPLGVHFNLDAVITDTMQGASQLVLQSGGSVHPDDLTIHYYAYPWWTDSIGAQWRSRFVSMYQSPLDAAEICRQSNPAVLTGYPTAIKMLMTVTTPGEFNLKLIITNSEQSSREERNQISAHFKCPVLDEYSSEELTRIALEMPDKLYYIREDAVFVEILNPLTGEPVADGEWGEVVATGLLNEAMPLVRYATGDLAKRPKSPKPAWNGIGWSQLEAIGGRIQDSFLKRDRSLIPSAAISDQIFLATTSYGLRFEDCQITQIDANKVRLSFASTPNVSQARLDDFNTYVQALLENLMECKILVVVSDHVANEDDRRQKRRPVRRRLRRSVELNRAHAYV
jgi:phenylacetate-CoA ligase